MNIDYRILSVPRRVYRSAKSVHIWFQNRRQGRRRGSRLPVGTPKTDGVAISGAAALSAAATASAASNPAASPRVKRAASTAASSSSAGAATPRTSRAPRRPAVLSHEPAGSSTAGASGSSNADSSSCSSSPGSAFSPPTPYLPWARDACSHYACNPPLPPHGPGPAPAVHARYSAWLAAPPNRPSLEWACARSAARRDRALFVYRDEDDSGGESSELERAPAPRSAVGRLGALGLVRVPDEYRAAFSPDVVLGAALLLGLKHSAGALSV